MRCLLHAVTALVAAAPCSSEPKGPGPDWLFGAQVFTQGVGVVQGDCRTQICRHNENTDLVSYQGALLLVHRTAESQILGPNSSLRVFRSLDNGASFAPVATLPAPADRDLRDPHFYQAGGELRLVALTRLPRSTPRDSDVDTVAIGYHSADGVTWLPSGAIGPAGWSFWRVQEHAGVLYSAAYADGDLSVRLFTSTDGVAWSAGPDVYTVSADTPLETELHFLPSGTLLALVRMDGTDPELLGGDGRLRTKVCVAAPPYASFSCPSEISGERLDGPLAFAWQGRLFVVARKHLQPSLRKRTALFELGGDLEHGAVTVHEWGELPSAGDTSYAGQVALDDHRVLVSWYSGDLVADDNWVLGMLGETDVWLGTIDLGLVQ